ncbi:para-nitrobenzyl esterase-like isoform X2 [Arctopsyche grandis]
MSNPEVTVEQGRLRGCTLTTENGYSYSGFMGIPYAKPPIGELRFRDPQYPEKWEGVRDVITESNDNPQLDNVFGKGFKGSEDSLYLNVFVPNGASVNSKLPVMVWIHGGAFIMGSGGRELYGPDFLIQANVIIVTINYRLGPIGFLCLNTAEVPGNAGLKDQVFALRWVHKNIHAFGGDVDNITIFGESAGGASVHYQMMSPMSKGLFHKAIIQSGMSTSSWATQKNPEKNAFDIAKDLGLESSLSTDKEAVLKFLMKVPIEDLVNAVTKPMLASDLNPFVPIVEQSFTGVEPFITVNPLELMTTGNYNTVPCIQGFTSQEGALFLMKGHSKITDITKVTKLSDSGIELPKVLAANFGKPLNDDKIAYITNKIEHFYFANEENFIDGYINLMTDLVFLRDIDRSAKLHSKQNSVYLYRLSYNGALNLFKMLVAYPYKGACHGDDLCFLFKQNFKMDELPEGVEMPKITESDILTIKRFVSLWTNFAKYGNPTPKLSDTITTIWEPVTDDNLHCLDIDNEMKMTCDPCAERIKFWKNLMD